MFKKTSTGIYACLTLGFVIFAIIDMCVGFNDARNPFPDVNRCVNFKHDRPVRYIQVGYKLGCWLNTPFVEE